MHRELRPLSATSLNGVVTTPAMWDRNFRSSRRLTTAKALSLRLDRRWRLVRRHLPARAAVLEAGCGFGEWVALLERGGFRAAGIDYSTNLVQRLRAAYPNHPWYVGDIRQLPFLESSFDAIVSWGVIEHLAEGPTVALREFARILRPDGVAIVTVPLDSPAQRRAAEVVFADHPSDHRGFFQYLFSPDELGEVARNAGLTVEHVGTLGGAPISQLWPRVYRRIHDWRLYPVLNRALSLLLWPVERQRNMAICVARKPS